MTEIGIKSRSWEGVKRHCFENKVEIVYLGSRFKSLRAQKRPGVKTFGSTKTKSGAKLNSLSVERR